MIEKHFIICRREHGWGTGPGSGSQAPDEIQVMAASRTEKGAKIAQKRLGGFIRMVDKPFRKYELNETIETLY